MHYNKTYLVDLMILLIVLFCSINCKSIKENNTHIFYLHGKIVQEQGINAVSEKFGKYEYTRIIDSLRIIGGSEIHAEIRKSNTNFDEFCIHTSNQIDSLIRNGIPSENITIVGASMGGVMAMKISSINKNPVNYIFLGSNNDSIEKDYDFNLHGRILGIYEKSDSICDKSYQYWINKSKEVIEFKQLKIETELGHGFLYHPLKEWINPVKKMVKEKRRSK